MKDLIIVEKLNPAEIFQPGGTKSVVEQIKEKTLSLAPDVSTAAGRKEIASLAHKIARSKTLLDKMGKELKEDAMKIVRQVDGERKYMRDELDKLKEEVRRPLTEYEEREKQRVAALEARVQEIKDCAVLFDEQGRPYASDVLEKNFAKVKSISIDESFEEFAGEAAIEKDKTIAILEEAIQIRKEEEQKAAELERFRKEQEEKERIEREKKIAEEAARKAREEAERKAAEAIRREKERAEMERLELLRQQEEEKRKEEERKRKEAEERARREADEKHRAMINDNIIMAMAKIGVDRDSAIKIIVAIDSREIPHVKIIY